MLETKIQRAKSVLILDDDIDQARGLEFRLKNSGFQVAVSFTGLQAIKKAQASPPDIALLDINLEGQELCGTDVGKKIKELRQDTIVIYITAFPSDENFNKALGSSPAAFIDKPYRYKTLNREIEMAVNQSINLQDQSEVLEIENTELPQNRRLLCFPDFLLVNEGDKGHSKITVSYTHLTLPTTPYV